MKLTLLRLHDFRSYGDMQILLEDGIHIFSGKNAQGKTNLLEAVYYLSTTKSHRTNRDEDLIREGCEAFFIRGEVEKKRKTEDLRIALNQKGKNLFIYQNPVKKVSDFLGELNAVMFCPDDMNLFQASPRRRRRFVDMELGKVSKKYVSTLYTAQNLLKERNAYLKQEHVDKNFLEVLTSQLIDVQVIIMKQRYHFLEELLEKSKDFYEQLSLDHTKLHIVYESCVPYCDDEDVLKEELKQKYKKTLDRDMYLKQTTIGIHKEDFNFQINGKDVDTYASQGQKRSVLLALKIGMVHMIHKLIDDYPVLLLDDVFSELDVYRRKKLLESLPSEVQIFISTTDISEAKEIRKMRKVTLWKVESGKVARVGG